MIEAPFILIIAIIGTALFFDFTNGFHDSANSISTVVSTKVLSPRNAVIFAAFFNFIAAFGFGVAVASTIAKIIQLRHGREAGPQGLVVPLNQNNGAKVRSLQRRRVTPDRNDRPGHHRDASAPCLYRRQNRRAAPLTPDGHAIHPAQFKVPILPLLQTSLRFRHVMPQ